MPLGYILRKFMGRTFGSNHLENAAHRAVALDYINEACEEIYDQTDLPGSHRELVVCVTPDEEVALPQFVGELRGMREYVDGNDFQIPENIYTMRPRYTSIQWPEKWRGWTFKGYSPIQRSITVASPPTLTIQTADSTIVKISGQTTHSNNARDEITMSATSVVGTKSFIDYKAISKQSVNDYDITVADSNGNVLAVLFNDLLESKYAIYDVSKYPTWTQSGTQRKMQILFKLPRYRLENDADAFPVPDFDDLVANKAIQLYLEDQPAMTEIAAVKDAKIERSIGRKIKDKEAATTANITFKPHGFVNTRRYYRM